MVLQFSTLRFRDVIFLFCMALSLCTSSLIFNSTLPNTSQFPRLILNLNHSAKARNISFEFPMKLHCQLNSTNLLKLGWWSLIASKLKEYFLLEVALLHWRKIGLWSEPNIGMLCNVFIQIKPFRIGQGMIKSFKCYLGQFCNVWRNIKECIEETGTVIWELTKCQKRLGYENRRLNLWEKAMKHNLKLKIP